MPRIARTASCLAVLLALPAALAAQTKLLRFPDIHGDKVVFTYAGDLWTAPVAGGIATRVTAHPGLEMFARFSPDGQWLAFTGQYDGDEQVYVVPSTGGVPKQLTFYPARGPMAPRWGYDNQVLGWTPDGKSVFFRSLRDGWDLADSKIFTVPVDGGMGTPLPMPKSGGADLSPDGKKVVYTPFARDFRTWKRYAGGWAQDLWIHDLATDDTRRITTTPRNERDPMWIGERIWFNSDRSGTLNLYSFDPATGSTEQVTKSTQWDVRWPSSDGAGQIVYELNGELNVLATGTGASRHLVIQVPDDGLHSRPSQVKADKQIEDFALSPKGERAVFAARGDVFNTPIEKGVTRNLTRTTGAHDKFPRWSPDGRRIAYISDQSGEDEVWVVDALGPIGSTKPEQLTTGGKGMRYAAEWSPDGKRLAFADKDRDLWVVTVADKKLVKVAHDPRYTPRGRFSWAPGSDYLAFSLTDPNFYHSIWIWSVADGKLVRVTSEDYDERQPAWDPEGKYLYYLSARSYSPQFDSWDFNFALDRNWGVFALALAKGTAHPFPPEEDEVTVDGKDAKDEKDEEKDKPEDKGKKKAKKDDAEEEEENAEVPKVARTKIDFDGLASRVARVPVPFDNYDGLRAAKGKLLFFRAPPPAFGEPAFKPELKVFTFEERKLETVAGNVSDFALSRDGSKVLVVQDGEYSVLEAKADGGGSDAKKKVSTAGLVVDRVPAEEWAEIFRESWRRYRDFFYVENMHGYDWAALRRQYEPLLAHVRHRSDLNYVIGEMISELNVSHAYVQGGDFDLPDRPPRPKVALPGARFELDEKAGRYRISRVFSGQNEEDTYRAPLTEVGVDVRVADYVLAIDGEELGPTDNPYRLLRHKADRPVRLTLNAKPALAGAREVVFRPISSETGLIYLDWITRNRAKVADLSGGRVGYIHLPDMGEDGMREFLKQYFGQIKKEGLIVDVRENGGGFVSQTLLERLGRKLLGVDWGRTNEDPFPYPFAVFHGHMACLLNEGSGSDGDIFPAMFRQMGLGPLIGTRTWGGVIGISGQGPLIDGGQVFVPESGSVDLAGEWTIEGYGVDPDIVVENDVKSVLAGRDPQLERGVIEVMKAIKEKPKKLPGRPKDPVKTP